MLVLSRKPGERILVGDEVKITVIRIGPNSVRIGIDAPGHLNIVREELCLNAEDGQAVVVNGSSAGGRADNDSLPHHRPR